VPIRDRDFEPPTIVRMTDADPARLAPLLARAFHDDPLFGWLEPEAERRTRFLAGFFEALAWRSHLYAEALVTAGAPLGASLWKGPDLRDLSPEQLRRSGLDRVGEALSPRGRARFESGFGRVDELLEQSAPGPRWYLGVLGVAPEAQGRGLGGALMRPILERADAERLPVTLETTRAANVEVYRRFGFEVTANESLPPDGPPFWTMRRAPR
jgi:ribosomal protein S18 acetylase RimI-like enzyme